MIYLVIALIVVPLFIFGASFYFYNVAIARAEKVFIQEDPDLQMTPELNQRVKSDQKWWDDQIFENWSLTSRDNLDLHGYYLPAKVATRQTVLLAHGYAGEASIMKEFARIYHEQYNMNILLPDARGHGKSEGKYIGFGWHERLDYLDWINQIIKTIGDDVEIILHGVSMGAATVMMTSGEPLPEQVKASIADCGYTSVKDELTYQMKRMYRLPAFPILNATSWLTKIRVGYSFSEASALNQVAKASVPILFIHGSDDAFVPTEMVNRLYRACTSEKQLLIIEGAAHGLANRTDPKLYQNKVRHFLDTYLN
ncbi:alpha/beta hydrolase [Amphibacillus jilinensis]|uniref:alpha/beta hydrolase n=1 Tax=Amphibacillus jilinensis TaxID=1216008 RepID=UPI0002EC48C8|nr:alpha/beta hydrolase [Amphibacillus jilinensis]